MNEEFPVGNVAKEEAGVMRGGDEDTPGVAGAPSATRIRSFHLVHVSKRNG